MHACALSSRREGTAPSSILMIVLMQSINHSVSISTVFSRMESQTVSAGVDRGAGLLCPVTYRYDRRHPRAASLQHIHSEGGGPDTSMLRNCARRFAYPPRASSRRSLHVGAKSAVGRAEVVKDRPDRLHQVGRGHRAPVLCKGGRAEAAREQAARVCCERGRGRPIGRQLRLGGARPAKHRGNRTRQDVALTAAPLRATALRVLEHGRAGTRRRHVHVASGGDLGRSSVGGRWGSRRRCLSVGCEARVHSRR